MIHTCRISPLQITPTSPFHGRRRPCFSDTPDLGPQRNRVWTLARVSDELIRGISSVYSQASRMLAPNHSLSTESPSSCIDMR